MALPRPCFTRRLFILCARLVTIYAYREGSGTPSIHFTLLDSLYAHREGSGTPSSLLNKSSVSAIGYEGKQRMHALVNCWHVCGESLDEDLLVVVTVILLLFLLCYDFFPRTLWVILQEAQGPHPHRTAWKGVHLNIQGQKTQSQQVCTLKSTQAVVIGGLSVCQFWMALKHTTRDINKAAAIGRVC